MNPDEIDKICLGLIKDAPLKMLDETIIGYRIYEFQGTNTDFVKWANSPAASSNILTPLSQYNSCIFTLDGFRYALESSEETGTYMVRISDLG